MRKENKMEKILKIGDKIQVSHAENYPYEKLPNGARFEWISNSGNPYDGLFSNLVVIEEA